MLYSEVMREITIDWAATGSVDEFYNAVLPQLGAPTEHAHSLEALWESVSLDRNDVHPPYRVDIVNLNRVPGELTDFALSAAAVFSDACQVHDGVVVCFYNDAMRRPATV
jgi:RNAse (barnase) inhibitor barstar